MKAKQTLSKNAQIDLDIFILPNQAFNTHRGVNAAQMFQMQQANWTQKENADVKKAIPVYGLAMTEK